MEPIAALPMYDFPALHAAHDEFWTALRRYLVDAGIADAPAHLTRHLGHFEVWRHPLLLFGQGCEYPLAESFSDSVRLVATPCYDAPGCEGAAYRSAIVVREQDSAQELAELRNRRCALNEPNSNSGMNLLRASVAPLAHGAKFFASVVSSGSHLKSLEMVAAGQADVAAIDCVSLAYFRRLYPSSVAAVRILGWTPSSPSLPFITAAATSDATLTILRSSLALVFADPALDSVRELLLLDGIDFQPSADFAEVRRLQREAEALGYPVIQ